MAGDRSRDRRRSASHRSPSASRQSPPRSRRRSRSPGDVDRRRAAAAAAALPAAAHRDELLAALRAHQVVVCVGETGSGKTTQIPQYLLHALQRGELLPAGDGGRVVVTQPRRVATVSVAQRVAYEMGAAGVGGASPVGYAVRFDDQTSASTRLKFVTDGVLVRECLRDPTLAAYAVVMLDEAHERSLHTDILFGLLRRALARRCDLRLLVTSATLDADKFAAFFAASDASSSPSRPPPPPPVVRIPGRVFPVDVFHSKQTQLMGLRGPLSPYVRAAVETTMQIHRSEQDAEGHILVFLTGQHEIQDACTQLERLHRDAAPATAMELRVLPLYGALSGAAQRAVFEAVPRRVRKVVVATNIAETSLTIDGVRFVVDCGFTKHKVYNPQTQIESLVVVPVSQVSAQQRAGRAGRTAPGKCFRLFSKESYAQMLHESVPEIRRTNLANTVLYLKVLGVHDVLHFAFLDPPAEDALLDALEQLFMLDAIDARGGVTTTGSLMAQFPLEPKLARALVEALALRCGDDMATVAAMLSVENVYAPRPHGESGARDGQRDELMLALAKEDLLDDRGDQLTYLRLFQAFAQQRSPHAQRRWCDQRELRFRTFSTAASIRRQLVDIMASLPTDDLHKLRTSRDATACSTRSRATRLRRAMCAGLFAHAVRRCNSQSSVYRSMDTDDAGTPRRDVQLLHLHPLSTLNYVAAPACCVYQELVATSRPFMRDVLAVDDAWVRECARGKTSVLSLAQLYALSGAQAPASAAGDEASTTSKKKTLAETVDAPSAPRPTDPEQATRDAIVAARARFVARKKPRVEA